MEHNNISVNKVATLLSSYLYASNLAATKSLMELFDNLATNGKLGIKNLETADDYVKIYDDNFYTYKTWEELLESEAEQGITGLTEEECIKEIDTTIFRLPCGWYVQYV